MYEFLLRNLFYRVYETHVRRRRTYQHVGEYEANQWKSLAELRVIQWEKLRSLLRYCHQEVPFYREQWKAQGIHWEDIKSLDDYAQLPTLTKEEIRANRGRMIAIPQRGRKTSSGKQRVTISKLSSPNR